ncbi:hypothetical protein [Dissulfurispira sp.]|uniref:hypothetical protein n=1 Tax=Dissulfurispira sp. TaxID=2817609 RepID=UPI002FD9036E
MDEQKHKILLADDDMFAREMLSVVLEDKGYVAKDAEDGKPRLKNTLPIPP